MKKIQFFGILFLAIIFSSLQGEVIHRSISGDSLSYREVCQQAILEDTVFDQFRSITSYASIVECGCGGDFVRYLERNETINILIHMTEFSELDLYGNPALFTIPGWGTFSSTTLRYVLVADHISRLFDLPSDYSVAEIGAGFGGQAFILSKLQPFRQYYIYDLPEAEKLIYKIHQNLNVFGVECLCLEQELPLESVDLVISNYALSECDRKTQFSYFERVISKSKRGYMIFNDINSYDHLFRNELLILFDSYGIKPTIHPEPVCTYTGNFLITWGDKK